MIHRCLHHTQSRAVLQRFGQVCDRASQLQDPVIGSGGKLQLGHGRLHRALAGIIQLTELAHLGRAQVGVAGNPILTEAIRA